MQGIDRWDHDEAYVPPLPHRGAPTDEVMDAGRERIRPPRDVLVGWERMDGEGGGSAPMNDAPEDGDLRFLRSKVDELRAREEMLGHWPP